MNSSLEEKRREIFELHQSWLRPESKLMRKPVLPASAPVPKQKTSGKEDQSSSKLAGYRNNWKIKIAVIFAIIFVIFELLFFSFELGWFR